MFTDTDRIISNVIRDVFFASGPDLTLYIGELEAATSSGVRTVTVDHIVRKVMGVWLASDTTFIGTNYYANPNSYNFTGAVITLDSDLPSAVTDIVVSYYQDCLICDWDASRRASRVSQCPTCDGLGMVLADGTAITIPVDKIRSGAYSEKQEVTGEDTSGNIVFKIKAEHLQLLSSAKKIVFQGKELIIQQFPSGAMRIEPQFCMGVVNVYKVFTQFKKY